MAKGQQKTNKEAKKPKKDTSPPKAPNGGEPVRATITTAVIPRGKIKNKYSAESLRVTHRRVRFL